MPDSLYTARQKKLSQALDSGGFHLVALNAGPSLRYFTGLDFHLSERPVIFFFAPDAAPVAVLPELERGKLDQVEFEIRIHTYGEDPSAWSRAFKNAAIDARLDFRRVAIEPTRIRVLELRLLENAAPRSAYMGGADVISSLRMVKDAAELRSMRRAVDVAQAAIENTLKELREGMTEREAASELVLQLLRSGSGSELPFAPIVAFGEHSANPHAVPGDRKLTPGDLVLFDWGATVDGYASDLTRMFSFGEIDDELATITSIVGTANKAARQAAKPGTPASEIDRAARSVIEDAGYGPAFVHRTGHGLGMETHEDPYIRAGNELPLQEGMVFTIEPGIYISGRGGARIEDDVVVTAEGAESLSTLERALKPLSV